jgi:nucleoside-diphosphate-sugar epimerase
VDGYGWSSPFLRPTVTGRQDLRPEIGPVLLGWCVLHTRSPQIDDISNAQYSERMTEVTVKCQPASLPSRPHKKLSSLPKRVAVTTGVSAEARALANEVAKQLEDAGCIVVQVRFDGDLEGAVVGSDAVVNVAGLDSACSSSVASLVKAAVAAKVSRIVTAACTDIMYDGKDIKGGSEATPVGDDGAAVGAAERIVLETKGLQACALRIAPLYGGQSLEVRLAQKAREGKVVQPGDGSNVTDFCFVGNAAYALILALDDLGRGSSSVTSGKVYIITDGEPVPRWDFLSRLLSGIGYSAPTASPWPVFLLLFFARILDIFASIVGAESKKTRELQFGTAYMYFNIEAARRDLGYDPLWTLDGAIDVTIQVHISRADLGFSIAHHQFSCRNLYAMQIFETLALR